MRRVCVFCGSNAGRRPAYAALARGLGRELAGRGLELVYGGGNVGLMGEIADAVLAAGGRAIGVIPRALMEREVGHTGITQLEVVDSMHDRKARMAELADAFIALPGGLGTMEELFEVLTWAQLGFHPKPVGLLEDGGYYQHLLAFLDHAVAEGFVRSQHRDLLLLAAEPAVVLDRCAAYRPPRVDKWLTTADEL